MSNQEQVELEEMYNDPEIMKAHEELARLVQDKEIQESFNRMVEEDTRNDQHQ